MKKKIVIVDDDEDLLLMLAFAFESKGFEVEKIKTGKAALKYFSNEKNLKEASVLILDRMLPDMDGLAILKGLKHPAIPVLILSVLSAEKDILEGLTSGAIDYIPKPFNLPILMQKVFALISRKT